jgi:hypothetical protein
MIFGIQCNVTDEGRDALFERLSMSSFFGTNLNESKKLVERRKKPWQKQGINQHPKPLHRGKQWEICSPELSGTNSQAIRQA